MKKIIIGCLTIFFCLCGYSYGWFSNQCSGDGKLYSGNESCGSCSVCNGILYGNTGCNGLGYKKCCEAGSVLIGDRCKSCGSLSANQIANLQPGGLANCTYGCAQPYTGQNGAPACCQGLVDENGACQPTLGAYGIDISTGCLINGQCRLNIYKVLGIRQSNQNPTVMTIVQDVLLAATSAIGTVFVISVMLAGLFYAIASVSGKDTKRPKEILVGAATGSLLVRSAYAIIRLIQFLATGRGG